MVIAAPLPLVWEITNDVARWTELFTEYAVGGDPATATATPSGSGSPCTPTRTGWSWSWVSERTADPATRQVRAHRVETGPFEYMRIHWRYDEVPGGTRMTWVQDFAMKPDRAGRQRRDDRPDQHQQPGSSSP